MVQSIVDEKGYDAIKRKAYKAKSAVKAGNWVKATNKWGATEEALFSYSAEVDIYNLQKYSVDERHKRGWLYRSFDFDQFRTDFDKKRQS